MSAEEAKEEVAKPKATGKTESSPTLPAGSQPFKILGVRDETRAAAMEC